MKRPNRSPALCAVASFSIAAASLVVAGLWFFLNHHESLPTSAETAEAEFAQLRARFADQQPPLDMARRAPIERADKSQVAQPLRSFHTVIFDTRGGDRIIRMTVPYWFGRFHATRSGEFAWLGQLTFLDDTEFDPEAIHLPLEQIEQRGPGLVVYYRHASGGQFITWVE